MKSILFDVREAFDQGRGFTHFAENWRERQKYWHRRVTQLVNYAWGGNDYPSVCMNNKHVSKKKHYFYSFFSYFPAIFAQLRWVLRKNCLHGIGESVNQTQVSSRISKLYGNVCAVWKLQVTKRRVSSLLSFEEWGQNFSWGYCSVVHFIFSEFCKVLSTFSSSCAIIVLDIVKFS